MKFLVVLALCGVALSEVYFEEKFDTLDAWVQSTHKGAEAGKFELSAGKFYGDEKLDQGAKTSQDARFYGMSAAFPPVSNVDKPLVIQFTVKHEQNIDCGGGYIKLFDCKLDQADMHGESPYNIMFGPDICGPGTKKVHVIFEHKGKNHLIKKDIRCKDDVFTHLYTLIVNTDGTYEVLIDNESAQTGALTDDWDFLPPKMIKDPEAKKPDDWVDQAKLDDPEDTKPEDWDKPEHIADPDATKPEDWDDEMDGEWEPPMIDNPDYKGEWKPRQIDNPDYKGPWVHPEIENPEYNPDDAKDIGKYAESCKIGFDLWQVKSGTIFDNMMITDDPAEAKAAGEALWAVTKEAEKKMKDAQDEEERAKAEAEAGEKADDEDDEDLDDLDEEEEDEIKEGDDEEAEGHDEL